MVYETSLMTDEHPAQGQQDKPRLRGSPASLVVECGLGSQIHDFDDPIYIPYQPRRHAQFQAVRNGVWVLVSTQGRVLTIRNIVP